MSTAAQIKHLNDRISRVLFRDPEQTKPPEVLKAEKTIAQWEKETARQFEKWRKQFYRDRTAAYEAVQFKAAEEALKIVRALEEKYP